MARVRDLLSDVQQVCQQLRSYTDFCLFEYAERKSARTVPVVAFCGYGRAGKDEAAIQLASVSEAVYGSSISRIMLPVMSSLLAKEPAEAWRERHMDRQLWRDAIDEFRCQEGFAAPVKMLLSRSDIVVGIRARPELLACVEDKVVDHLVWVDRPDTEIDPTVEYTREEIVELGGTVIVNDGSKEALKDKVQQLWLSIT